MYSCEKNVQILIALLKEYGINKVVLSPGGSDAPVVKSFEYDTDFECFSVVDERNAAYVAMGMAQELESPVVCVCTAGTAVSNYLPGITEAFYQNIPVIAITTDSSSYLLNQLELQKIEQNTILKDVVRKQICLPPVKNDDDAWYCNRIVNEALLEMNHHGSGPIHINLPITQTLECSQKQLPTQRLIKRFDYKTDMKTFSEYLVNKKVMVIIGENSNITEEEHKLLECFYNRYNCFYSVETISNYKGTGSVVTYQATETGAIWGNNDIVPDVVISIGNFIASYKLKEFLKANHLHIENWLVNESGLVRDPYKCLTRIFECTVTEFFSRILNEEINECKNHSYYENWKQIVDSINLENNDFSSLSVAKSLAKSIPDNSILHTAILNSTRIMQFSNFKNNIKYYSNLGALGIDGCVATFIGQSFVTEKLSYLLIGDLSFFYGLNGTAIRGIKNNVRIILLNNGGGEEFKIKLPYTDMDKYICAQCKRVAKGTVEDFGFEYYNAKTLDEVEKALDIFAKPSAKPLFLEVFLDIDKDSKIIRDFYASYNKQNINSSLKSKIGSILPEQTKNALKTLLKK